MRDRQVWSFFTGAMGLDLGLEHAGIAATFACEIEPIFCETIALNRPELHLYQGSVADLSLKTLQRLTGRDDVFLMVGGPPCQSFCPGGKRAALSDPRGNLIFEYLRLVSEVRPEYFILENVANLVTAAVRHRPIEQRPGKRWNLSSYTTVPASPQPSLFTGTGAFSQGGDEPAALEPDELSGSAVRYLLDTAVSQLGYSVTFGVLDSAEIGAPQRRLRFVLVGARDHPAPALPHPTHGPGREPFVTVKDAIADLRDDPGPGSAYTPDVRRVFDQVPPGGNWRDLSKDVAAEAMGEKSFAAGGGKTGFFRRLAWDAPAPTITGKANRKGSALCHPEASRPLSVRECARLQGFPDSWQFAGPVNKQYMQVGNAVPLALGMAVGQMLGGPRPEAEGASFESMLNQATTKLRNAARNKRGRQ
jgi:DNA (cytosine-5)-methyltransferase 1